MNCRRHGPVSPRAATRRAERGTVLMETVIVLPIFMALIGGIMWSGQLIYEKQKLLVADRYVAWNYGNRHAQNYSDVNDRVFGQSTLDTISSPHTQQLNSSGWWQEVEADTQTAPTMPVWTRGWFYGNSANAQAANNMPTSLQLYGRDNGSSPGGHVVVMEQSEPPTDSRNEKVDPDNTLNVNYDSIYNETWPTK